jgi:hypothetical protein
MSATDELSPTPSPRSPLFSIGFRQPSPEPYPLPDESLTPSPVSSPPGTSTAPLPDSADDEWPLPLDDESESPAGTSSPASTPVANPLNDAALRDVFRGGVLIAGDQAHNALARTEGQRDVGLYRTDEEDAQNIGDPLARIAGRHQGVGKVNPDTADLLAAMVGLTRYATKQIGKSQQAKQLDGAGRPQPAPEAVDL